MANDSKGHFVTAKEAPATSII
nr:zinc-ribbon domain-containing protein [Escherichia coli]